MSFYAEEEQEGCGLFDDGDILNQVDESGWISSNLTEHLALLQNERGSAGPAPDDWDEVEHAAPILTVDKARREGWHQGKAECRSICGRYKRRVDSLFGNTTRHSKQPALTDYAFFKLFGAEDSRVGHLFRQKLNMNAAQYCQFMATFFTSCQFKTPVSKLHASKCFDSTNLMPLDEYHGNWRKIASAGTAGSDSEPFWMEAEEICNKDLSEIFLPTDTDQENFLVALDDDKMHYRITFATESLGLKQCRHVRDNVTGYTAHTSALAAMDVPIRIDMERERDSPHICYVRQIKKLFGGNCGDGIPNLSNVTVASDRGYWNVTLLFSFLLCAGANVIGTVKRISWFPFTYDRKGGEGKPTVIDPKGAKNAYYRKLKLKNVKGLVQQNGGGIDASRALTAVAYRNGSGNNVTMAMSSMHPAHWWDFSLAKQEDSVWYFSKDISTADRNAKAFKLIQPEHHDGSDKYPESKKKRIFLQSHKPSIHEQLHSLDKTGFLTGCFLLPRQRLTKLSELLHLSSVHMMTRFTSVLKKFWAMRALKNCCKTSWPLCHR
jgi:hypothetical protein